MDSNQLNEIFRMAELSARYTSNDLTDDERQELEQWIGQSGFNRELFEDFTHEGKREQALERLQAYDLDAAWEKAQGRMKKRPSVILRWQSAAAVLILAIGLTVFFLLINKANKQQTAFTQSEKTHDVPPGGNKAVLTLANGNQIVLDSNANGLLSQQGNMQVINLAAGQLAYKTEKNKAAGNEKITFNTLTTPRGGQYQIILPDGSKVWLNAASSLRYPVRFSGNERKVTLTGEAYFEVAENKNMPFNVKVSGMEIKVLGTHFNVMAYDDEASVKTALLEGKVMITKAGENKILKPGEQATMNVKTGDIEVAKADVYNAIAWKNGFFAFDGTDIKAVMRQLARWYNVTIEYEGQMPPVSFSGKIQRNLKLSVVLKYLKKDGIKFSIEDKKIILAP